MRITQEAKEKNRKKILKVAAYYFSYALRKGFLDADDPAYIYHQDSFIRLIGIYYF